MHLTFYCDDKNEFLEYLWQFCGFLKVFFFFLENDDAHLTLNWSTEKQYNFI